MSGPYATKLLPGSNRRSFQEYKSPNHSLVEVDCLARTNILSSFSGVLPCKDHTPPRYPLVVELCHNRIISHKVVLCWWITILSGPHTSKLSSVSGRLSRQNNMLSRYPAVMVLCLGRTQRHKILLCLIRVSLIYLIVVVLKNIRHWKMHHGILLYISSNSSGE